MRSVPGVARREAMASRRVWMADRGTCRFGLGIHLLEFFRKKGDGGCPEPEAAGLVTCITTMMHTIPYHFISPNQQEVAL